MSTSKSIVFKYTYATSALKQSKITVFGQNATAFVAGQDYDENVIFKVPAASLSALILYYNGVVPNGSVGSSELASLRTLNAGVSGVPAYDDEVAYYLGDIVLFTPPGTSNASCYTLVRTTSVLSDPVPTQGTTAGGYTGPVIGQNRYYQAYVRNLPPVESTGLVHTSYWSISTIASGYTATIPYYAGDRVVYQGNVYQCITTNGLLDSTVTLLGTFGTGNGTSTYYGYDKAGIRYILNVLPTNSKFWLYSALPAVPSSTYTYLNWAQTDIGGLNSIDGSGGVIMKWDGTRPADLLPTATSGGILGGSGTVTFTFYTDDELNKVNTLLNLYNQNQNSFSLVNANAILAKLPAAVIKSQTSSASLEPDQQLAQLINAGPKFTSPTSYNTVVQSIFEEAVANDMLYTTNSDGTRTKLNQLSTHGFPDLLAALEVVKTGSTNAFAQAKASMGVAQTQAVGIGGGGFIASAGSGYTNNAVGTLVFAEPDTPGITATGTVTISGTGGIASFTITNSGSGYTKELNAPTVTGVGNGTGGSFNKPRMVLVGAAMTSFGGYYSNSQAITVAVQNPSSVSSSLAAGLTTNPITYTIATGTTPTIRTTLNSFTLVAPGSGYTSVPNVIVNGSTDVGGSLPSFNAVMGVNQIATKTGYTGIPVTNLPLRVAVTGSTSTAVTGVTFNTPNVVLAVNSSTGFIVGDSVQVTGLAAAANNGIFTITAVATGTITFANSAGVTATGQTGTVSKNFATVNPVFYGSITAIGIANGGNGYLSSDKVIIRAPYNGVSPTTTVELGSGAAAAQLATATLSTSGSGFYTTPNVVVSAPAITADVTAAANGETGKVTGFSVISGGTGYRNAPYLNISPPPTSVTAVFLPVIAANGDFVDVEIVNPGIGYTYGGAVPDPFITIFNSATTPTTVATFRVTITNGSVTDVQIVTKGEGYDRAAPPTLKAVDPPQSIRAEAAAVLTNGVVTSCVLVSTAVTGTVGGTNTGYSSAPTLTIPPPLSGTVTSSSLSGNIATINMSGGLTGASTITPGQTIITLTGFGVGTGNGTYTVLTSNQTDSTATLMTFYYPFSSIASSGTVTVGVRATAIAEMSGIAPNQTVGRVVITNPGSGYTSTSLSATVSSGNATVTIQFASGGVGYTSAPSVGVIGSTSVVISVAQDATLGTRVPGPVTPFSVITRQASVLATISNNAIGSIASLSITNAGEGYTSAPTLRFIAGAGRTAQASLTVNTSGTITEITMIDGGYGYGLSTVGGTSELLTPSTDVVISSAGGAGFLAQIPTVSYTLDRFVITSRGTGYTAPPSTVVTHYTGGALYTATPLTLAPSLCVVSIPTSIGLTGATFTGGVGYSQTDARNAQSGGGLTLTVGPGVGGVAANLGSLIPIYSGVVQSVTITSPGTGYSVNTSFSGTAPASGTGTPVTGYISEVNAAGGITQIVLTNSGAGYGFTPSLSGSTTVFAGETITITINGAGTGASLTVGTSPTSIIYNIVGFKVTKFGVYNTPPSITVNDGAVLTSVGNADAALNSPTYVALGTLVDSVRKITGTIGVTPSPTDLNGTAGIGLFSSPQLIFDSPPQATTARVTAVISNKTVSRMLVTNGGFGYDFVPTVTIIGYGTGATATAVMNVAQVFIAGGGTNYRVGNVFTAASPGGSGVAATITVTQVDAYGAILNTFISQPGLGYTVPPASATVANGSAQSSGTGASFFFFLGVASVTVTSAGSAYDGVPSVVVQPPSFTSSTAAITAKTGRITSLALESSGTSGYTVNQKCRLLGGATKAAPATEDFGYILVTAITGSGGISAFKTNSVAFGGSVGTVTITNGGSGYSSASPPAVTFSAPGTGLTDAATAVATAVVSAAGVVTGIVFATNVATSYGSGYLGVPTVTIAAPAAGVTATAEATLDGGYDYRPGDVLVVEGGIGGKVVVNTISSTIARQSDVKITDFGSGYLSVPKIKSYGGAQGIVLATSLKLYKVEIPPSTYVNNGLFRDGDGVFADIPGSGVVRIGSLAGATGSTPSVTVTNQVDNLSTYPSITVVGSGAAVSSRLAATGISTINTDVGGEIRGTVTAVSIGTTSPSIGVVTGVSLIAGNRQTLTFNNDGILNASDLKPGMFISPSVTTGFLGSTPLAGPFEIASITGSSAIVIVNYNTVGSATTGLTTTMRISGGAYYIPSIPPIVTFSNPPTAIQAAAVCTVESGVLTAITITNAGSGYMEKPGVSLNLQGLGGSGAAFTYAMTSTGTLGAFTITNGGSGYNSGSPPLVIIDAPPPSFPATGTAIVTTRDTASNAAVTLVGGVAAPQTGHVTAVTITNGGSGYTSAPTVTFSTPTLGSIVANADCGLSSVQITASVTGFNGSASVVTDPPSGPLSGPTQALILPLKFREVTGFTGLTNRGVGSVSSYSYPPGVFPLLAVSAPALSTTATEAGADATQLITNERSNGFTFTSPQFLGWYGVNFNVGDTFQFLVKYTVAKAVVFEVDTDVTIPGLTTASTSITIGGVTIPLYNPSTGTGVGRELSTNAIVQTYMVTLKAS